MSASLEGIRILDLTQVQAGPSCTQLLAWLGADIIKIEEPGVGDRTRREMAHRANMDSFYFLVFNANKKSLCLNLKAEEGQEIFRKLVKISDVLVENLAPGRMETFGLDYDRIKKINPRIVYASIKGFGSYGPYAGFRCFENIAQAMSGAMSTNGEIDGPPLFISAGVGDSGSGLHCAIGILAALMQRERTGAGDYLEVSMQDAVVNLNRIRIFNTLATGEPLARTGNMGWTPPSLVFPCHPGGRDDYVTIYIGGDAWDSLLAVIGQADLIGDERYATREARAQQATEIEEFITNWTSKNTKHEVMAILNQVGIPCGAVLNTQEVLEDEHLITREMVVEVNDPNRGDYLALGCPIKIGSNTVRIDAPPLLGEHTEEILSTLLGFDDHELERLRKSSVV